MSDAPRVHHYYYSAYHLAGDFIWGVGIFSLFVTLGAILFPELRSEVFALVKSLDALSSSSLAVLAGVLYTLIGAAAAVIAQRAALGLRDFFRLLPGRGEDIGYRALYRLRSDELQGLYRRHFTEFPEKDSTSNNDMVNRLIAYMKLYNPEGYNHVYRTYTLVALYRQSIFFTFLLLLGVIWKLSFGVEFFLLVGLFLTFCTCLRFTVERSVASEFDFIFATSRWIADQRGILLSEVRPKVA
jgi:hypothetical protein